MKKFLLLYKILFLSLPAFAQLTISSGTQWVNNGNVTINLSNLDMINNGTFVAANSNVKFAGNANSNIAGSMASSFYQIEVSKSANGTVLLESDVNVSNQVIFTAGLLDLNQKN